MRNRKKEDPKNEIETGNVGEAGEAREQGASLEEAPQGRPQKDGQQGASWQSETDSREGGRKAAKRRRQKDEAGIAFMLMLMASVGIAEGVVAGFLTRQEMDQILVLAFVGILYNTALLAGMELCRRQRGWFYEKAGNYRRIAFWHGLTCAGALGMLFLPEFARPLLVLSMGMAIISNSFLGMLFGLFHGMVYALCGQGDIYSFLCSILLAAGGCLAAYLLEARENLPWKAVFLFLYTFVDVLLFSYLAHKGILEWDVLALGAGNGLVSCVAGAVLGPALHRRLLEAPKEQIERILQEDFGLVQDVRNFSKIDYEHAKKVSRLAGACASLVGADPDVASAGGFYYRLGRMLGEPFVENGVALAKSSHLPRPVVEILSEYYGREKLPSTVESAIVHIVDSLVAKFEVMKAETQSSGWNQDILVYQTLNENSAAGLYDRSGCSMNMFLKIRDYLIKEAGLL